MRPKPSSAKKPAEQVVKDIRRAIRRHFSAEDKIRIVLEGLRGDDSIAELCRKERHRTKPVLRVVEGVHGGWQAPSGGRHRPRRHQ